MILRQYLDTTLVEFVAVMLRAVPQRPERFGEVPAAPPGFPVPAAV